MWPPLQNFIYRLSVTNSLFPLLLYNVTYNMLYPYWVQERFQGQVWNALLAQVSQLLGTFKSRVDTCGAASKKEIFISFYNGTTPYILVPQHVARCSSEFPQRRSMPSSEMRLKTHQQKQQIARNFRWFLLVSSFLANCIGSRYTTTFTEMFI